MIKKLREALNRHILAYRPDAGTAAVKCGCSACKVCIEQWEADIALVRSEESCEYMAELLKVTGINALGHDFRCSGCAVAHAQALREVLLKLAPHVAVHSRNPLVSPEGRSELLSIEPTMLKVLLDTKYLGDP